MKVLGFLILMVAVIAAVFLYIGWYQPATSPGDDPYDEVFIAVNRYLPQPMRNWACDELAAEFGENVLPPVSCEDVWGASLP